MAKKDKAEKAAKNDKAEAKKQTPPPQPPKPKYGVPELAEVLGVKPSSVRVRLRNAGIEKSGKLYGWDSKTEMMEVANKLKATARKAKEEDAEDEEEEETEDEE